MARKRMLHDEIGKRRLKDTLSYPYDQTGLRQIPIAEVMPHGSTDPKPARPVRDSATPPATPITGRQPRLEPPLNRPLIEPSGPPSGYGWDNLGTTAAPPRYVPPTSMDIAAAREEAAIPRFPAAPAEWPHGSTYSGEAGVAGTGIFSGFISASTTGEFNPDMFGWNAMRIYEQMRRTDADVSVALFAMKLPLLSVTPEIIAGEGNGGYEGNGNLAEELAQFARDTLFGGIERPNPMLPNTWVSQSFDEVKENGFLMLDFGCAGHENLYRVDGDKIRIRYLAPRLPWTYYRFWTAEDGETLTGLEQLGYRRERYVSTTIPANNLCLFVNRKEGSNFYGISALRSAYQHWYTKSQFYRIDAIAMERNGMGIPWIKFPPGAKTQDITNAQNWVQQMAVSERTGIATPDGYDFQIAGLKGRLRDPINSIKHHSQEIVRSVMAMFVALGTTETGSRALANTLLDLFRQSLQHYANVFCSVMNNFTLKPLIDLNYAPRNGQRLPYPKLAFPSIVVIDPVETATVLKDLANAQVDLVRPSQELEKALLEKFGLPLGEARTKFAPTMTQVRIMAQPAGESTVEQVGESIAPIEQEKPLVVPPGATPVQPAKGAPPRPESGRVTPTGQGDEFSTGGTGMDIHKMINEIVAGPHGTAAKRAEEAKAKRKFRLSDLTDFQGIPITIENPPGTVRHGMNADGTEWETTMRRPYGYIHGVLGLDQEELDCFVGPYKKAKNVYIVRTRDPRDGTIDEEKVFLGFRGQTEAKNTFLKHYDSPDFFRSIHSMSLARFKQWMKSMGGKVMSDAGGFHEHPPEIGYDLDGTLAEHIMPFDERRVGNPIPESVEKVKKLQAMGYKVWIFTARRDLRPVIRWSMDHNLNLPATNQKRPTFIAIIDDRAVNPNESLERTIEDVRKLDHHPSQESAKKD